MPFFGPSSFRDAVGSFVDFKLDPINGSGATIFATRNSVWGLYFVNLRANLLDSTKILDEAALDPYEFQRDAYLQRRRNLVYDGNPPPEKDEEDIPELKVKPRIDADEPAKPTTGEAAARTAPAPMRCCNRARIWRLHQRSRTAPADLNPAGKKKGAQPPFLLPRQNPSLID